MSTKPTPPSEPQPAPHEPGARLSAGAILSLGAAALLLAFMLQNTQDARVHFLFWRVTLPLWFVILGSALVGAVVWLGFGVLRHRRRRKLRRETRKG